MQCIFLQLEHELGQNSRICICIKYVDGSTSGFYFDGVGCAMRLSKNVGEGRAVLKLSKLDWFTVLSSRWFQSNTVFMKKEFLNDSVFALCRLWYTRPLALLGVIYVLFRELTMHTDYITLRCYVIIFMNLCQPY